MAVEQFPPERIKRIPVNLPFERLPSCEHDTGRGGEFECSKCPPINALTDAILCDMMKDNGLPTMEREPLRSYISAMLGLGYEIRKRDEPIGPPAPAEPRAERLGE
jgi:hypothetical protein